MGICAEKSNSKFDAGFSFRISQNLQCSNQISCVSPSATSRKSQTFRRRVDVLPQNIMKTLSGCSVAGQRRQQQQFNSPCGFSLSRLLHEASCRHRGGFKLLLIEHLFQTGESLVLVCLFFFPSSSLPLLLFSTRGSELDPATVPAGKKENLSRFRRSGR